MKQVFLVEIEVDIEEQIKSEGLINVMSMLNLDTRVVELPPEQLDEVIEAIDAAYSQFNDFQVH